MSFESDRQIRGLLLVLAVYGLFLSTLGLLLPDTLGHRVFSERGPFEIFSVPLWIVLGAWCFDPVRPGRRGLTICGLLSFFAAAREADWHKQFTADSAFKISYYLKAQAPLYEKVPAAIVALLSFALMLAALIEGLRFARSGGAALGQTWFQVILIGVLAVAVTKVLDRVHSWLESGLGYAVVGRLGRLNGSLEEGFEVALPLIFMLGLRHYRRQQEA